MSQENMEVVRAANMAWLSGDLPEVATKLGCVYIVEGGKIVRWQMFFSEEEALEVVGPR